MLLSEVFNSQTIAVNYTEAGSNAIPYLGVGLFPEKKKAGLELKWIKGNKGLPISLAPSAFDAKSKFRDRIGVSVDTSDMAFFRESMLVNEKDEQEILRAQDANDPYAKDVLDNIFNDSKTLVDGALVVPERMRMQLLSPKGGNMGINISANGANYTYNYDPDGSWKKEHYLKIETAADKWSAADTCDPLQDLEDAIDAQEIASGTRPSIALMSKKTFKYMKNSKAVQSAILAQNATANVNYTSKKIKELIKDELDLDVIIYSKKFRDESGKETNFYPDDIVMLIPAGAIGSTYFGTTPEERTLSTKADADVSLVNTGVAVSVTITDDPVNTKTTVSEIVLPSFEGANECYAIEVC